MNISLLRSRQIPVNTAPRAAVAFNLLFKPVGAGCNLACGYCYYPQRQQRIQKMDDGLLTTVIRDYIAAQPHQTREINFVWQGGEPLLAGIGFYKRVLELQQRYAPPGVIITNSLQTNATLLNDVWCRLFKQHRFIIGVSLDGDKSIQDRHRLNLHGQSSYDAVIRGISLLRDYQLDFNLLVVVHDGVSGQAREIYDHLVGLGVRYLQFQPLVSQGNALSTHYHLSAENWGAFMLDIYHRWSARGDRGKIFVMNIEHIFAQYFTGISPNCVHAPRCGSNLVLEPDGGLFACDHLINASHYIGHFPLTDTLASRVQASMKKPFGQQKSQRPECQRCSVNIVCQGGCPAHTGGTGTNQLCAGYYAFFSRVLAPLRAYSRDMAGFCLWRYQQRLAAAQNPHVNQDK